MTMLLLLVKASILIASAGLAQSLAARRASAATRHLIWAIAMVGLLLLPVLSATLPSWTAFTLTATASGPQEPGGSTSTAIGGGRGYPSTSEAFAVASLDIEAAASPAPTLPERGVSATPPLDLMALLVGVYAAGVLLLLSRVIVHHLAMRRLLERAAGVNDERWLAALADAAVRLGITRRVRLVRFGSQTMPMACGIVRPAIVIPQSADAWSEERRRAVLLHELAHVARWDCLTQVLAAVVTALYWVHPGVWWLTRRLRLERELACDDRVLEAGTDAADYADHLLQIAFAAGRTHAPALAVTMAETPQLEGRLRALIDAARNRSAPARRSRLVAFAILIVVLVPVAAATTKLISSRMGTQVPERVQADDIRDAPTTSALVEADLDAEPRPGTWEIRSADEAGRVYFQMREARSSHGYTIDLIRLSGLAPTQLAGTGPVQFSLRRDAGTFAFDGVAREGVAAGTFEFIPDPAFPVELVRRGFAPPTLAQQYRLARTDVGFGFIDELSSQNYARPDLPQLIRAAEHDVSLSYLRDMGQLGYRLGRLERLIELRDHDVTPQFARGLAGQRLGDVSADDLIRARNHDVTPDYVAGLSTLGYRRLPIDVLVQMRSHDVMPSYVSGLQALGYKGVAVEQLLTMRGHDVQPAYIQALQALGYRALDVEELVELRGHDVEPDEIRRANASAGRQLDVERLTELAARGWQ